MKMKAEIKVRKAYINGSIITMEADIPQASALVTGENKKRFVSKEHNLKIPVWQIGIRINRNYPAHPGAL